MFEPLGFVLRPEVGAISMAGSSIGVALNAVPSVPARRGSIDLVGAGLATGALAALVFAIVRAPEEG